MAESLKPCPFCGGNDIRIHAHANAGSYPAHAGETVYTIGCYDCGGSVPGRYRRELVVESWNKRPEVERCGKCKPILRADPNGCRVERLPSGEPILV